MHTHIACNTRIHRIHNRQNAQVVSDRIQLVDNDDIVSSEMLSQQLKVPRFMERNDIHPMDTWDMVAKHTANSPNQHSHILHSSTQQILFPIASIRRGHSLAILRALHNALSFAGFPLWRFKPDSESDDDKSNQDEPILRSQARRCHPHPASVSRSQPPSPAFSSDSSLQASASPEQSSQESARSSQESDCNASWATDQVANWPCRLVVSMDESSSWMSAMSYLIEKQNLDVLLLPDVARREWTDVMRSFNQAGLSSLVAETTFVLNLPHGPWKECKWFLSNMEACPFINKNLLPPHALAATIARLARLDEGVDADNGAAKPLLDPGFSGHRVSISESFQWIQAFGNLTRGWHRLLAIMLFQAFRLEVGGDSDATLMTSFRLQGLLGKLACLQTPRQGLKNKMCLRSQNVFPSACMPKGTALSGVQSLLPAWPRPNPPAHENEHTDVRSRCSALSSNPEPA